MTNNYFKVRGKQRIAGIQVAADPSEESENGLKKVAAHGYVGWQEFFFFDDRSPDQAKKAYEQAEFVKQSMSVVDARVLTCVYRRPKFGGPWDSLDVVGFNYGELA